MTDGRFDLLLDSVLSGQASIDERKLFNAELEASGDRRREFREQAYMTVLLKAHPEALCDEPAARRPARLWLPLAAGLAVLLAGLGWAGSAYLRSRSHAPAAARPVPEAAPALPPAPVVTSAPPAQAVLPAAAAPTVTPAPATGTTSSAAAAATAVVPIETQTVGDTNMNKLAASVSALAVTAALTTTPSIGGTAWLGAVDGNWNSAASWSDGLPTTATPAFLTNTAASYTVSLTNGDASAAITNLTVANAGGNTATLAIGAALTADTAFLNFGAGARIHILTNGILNYLDSATTRTQTSHMNLTDGAEMRIDGGTLQATNQTGFFTIGNGGGTVSRLVMTSGAICLTNKIIDTFGNLNINRGGLLEASGGRITSWCNPGYYNAIQLDGGTLNLSGNASLTMLDNWSRGWNGDFILSDQASATFKIIDFIGREDATNHIFLSGDSSLIIAGEGDGLFQRGSNGQNALKGSTLVCIQDNASITSYGAPIGIGISQGNVEMDIDGGKIVCRNFAVGQAERYPTDGSPTGLVEMTGGLLHVISNWELYNYYTTTNNNASKDAIKTIGFAVGVNVNDVETPGAALGTFNFSGGIISNTVGRILIGAGATGRGRFVQNGGTFYQQYNRDNGHAVGWGHGTTAIGVCGGDGAYTLSNGTFRSDWHVCVGGASSNEWDVDYGPGDVPPQELRAERGTGLLDIEGGTFTVQTNQADLIVGACGSGTVKIGPAGTCTARNIILTNGTDAAVDCVLGATGLGTLQAAEKLIIYGDASLTVDATAYTGSESWIPLIRCASRTGSFEAANITVKNNRGKVVQDHDNTGTIYLHLQHGTLFRLGN